MDPMQTPRAAVESNAPRPQLMQVKHNQPLPPSAFHTRPPGPPPGSPRYPINNGSAGGPRLGGRPPPPDLHRLDSRSTVGSPTSLPNQFVQQRPPFGPPRSQITPAPSPGNFPRAVSPSNNPSNQPPLRYPNPASSPSVRGPVYSSPGQRPPFNPNSQQFLRPQRPASFESGGVPSSHPPFGAYPQANENRQVTPRIVSETSVTPSQNNSSLLKTTKIFTPDDDQNTQKITRIPLQSREKMENNEKLVNLNVTDSDHERGDKHETPKRRPISGNSNDNGDNDDDDVIMDVERDSTRSPIDVQSTAQNKTDTSKNTIPILQSDVKSVHEDRPNSRMSVENVSVINNRVMSNEQLSESKINDSELEMPLKEKDTNPTIDKNNLGDNVSGFSNDKIPKSPSPSLKMGEKSPDRLTASPVPTSLTLSTDTVTGVMGYDNGKLRSLSPKSNKSPSPGSSPSASSKRSATPVTPIDEKIKENLSEDINDVDDSANKIPQSATVMPEITETLNLSRTPTPKSSMKQSSSSRSLKSDSGRDNGINSTSSPTTPATNGVAVSPTKKLPTKIKENDKSKPVGSPIKSPSKSIKSLPRTPESGQPSSIEKKKVPMNKVQVGAAPSPNLKTVRSKIGSLDNTSYKPGGGKVKIENRKLDFSKAQPKIAAKNDKYAPSGGDKKITQVKLQWNAKPKVGSLDNATYKPGGGDKKIETVKLDFKDKAKPKVGSKENAKHVPGGGTVKSTVTPSKTLQELSNDIETQKIDIKAESKVGSMDNMKHKPGGGDKKIFNDRDYLRQTSSNVDSVNGSGGQEKINELKDMMKLDPNPPPSTPTRSRSPLSSLSSIKLPVTARAVRSGLQAKSSIIPKNLTISIEKNSENFDNDTNDNEIFTNNLQDEDNPLARSPTHSEILSNDSTKIQETLSPSNSRETSPKAFHLPKLTNIITTDVLPSEIHTQKSTLIKLPKLNETSILLEETTSNQ